jgi:hypothetical protein
MAHNELDGGLIVEKAMSKAQQRFMGMVYAAKKGEPAASPEVAQSAKEITKFKRSKVKLASDKAHWSSVEKVKLKKWIVVLMIRKKRMVKRKTPVLSKQRIIL